MSEQNSVNRRTFLKTGTVLAATTAGMTAASYAKVKGANDRIRIGFIGVGGMGSGHINAIAGLKEKNNLEGVAVADCWKTRAAAAAKKVGAEKSFQDYHKVLDIKDIDYTVIAVPEHWHAKIAIDAMDAGKAIYVEKPMTHTFQEGLEVMKKQKETKRPLQVGVQAMSDDSYSSAAKVIEEGMLGQVVQAQIEYVRRYNKQGPWRKPGLKDNTPQPADLDWKTWIGHAPKIDWNPHHFYEWRNYARYSGGICTDLFIHRITRIMKACGLLYPRRVTGMGGIWQWPDGRDLPDNFEMICEYPRGMTVYVLGTMSNRVGIDHLIRGYRATMYFHNKGWTVKNKDGKVIAEHQKTGGEDIRLHHTNLQNHLRNGEELNCPVELGMAGVAAVTMANESWRTSQVMGWDEKNQKIAPANTLDLPHTPDKKA
jgi:predicted dehydrogenase